MAQDPEASRGVLGRRTKLLLTAEDSASHLKHAKSLPQQGVGNLSSAATKFILNAASDTLPHNSNLSLWERGVPRGCPLCGQQQTLHHILNHCPVALDIRRFMISHRHNAVLTAIAELVAAHLAPPQQMIVDLPGYTYHYPPNISCTDTRPYIVVWDDIAKQVSLIELTGLF